jgi:hypothetical protein
MLSLCSGAPSSTYEKISMLRCGCIAEAPATDHAVVVYDQQAGELNLLGIMVFVAAHDLTDD